MESENQSGHTDHSGIVCQICDVSKTYITEKEALELFDYIEKHSELRTQTILDEIEMVLTQTSLGPYFYQALSLEEIAFLIINSRYQEEISKDEHAAGLRGTIDVTGEFKNKYLFLVSEKGYLPWKTMEKIEDLMKRTGDKTFRMASYVVHLRDEPENNRRLYILETEDIVSKKIEQQLDAAREHIKTNLGIYPRAEVEEFLDSATPRFIHTLLHNQRIRTLGNYLISWRMLHKNLSTGRDIFVNIDQNIISDEPVPERRVQLWVPEENFKNNFVAINRIFEKKGIPFTRQYFETFIIHDKRYIAFSTYISNDLITPELETFFINELNNRSILMKSTPVPVREIKTILDFIKTSGPQEKRDLIRIMQQNKQKEYLIPLVLLLNDTDEFIKMRAFELIKNYIFTPTGEMKSDYYWATLFNIFAAATVPIKMGKNGDERALTDGEITRLIRFRDIYYNDYLEPVTGKPYLFIRMSGIGIGKGGIRADEHHVSFSGEGALSTNMLFKTLGLGIPLYTTGKGGILGDMSDVAGRGNVLSAYADFLYYQAGVGPLSDVPAGDVGIGPEEIGVIFERINGDAFRDIRRLRDGEIDVDSPEAVILKKHFGIDVSDKECVAALAEDENDLENYTASSITGKPGAKGLKLRTGATAKGLVEVFAVIKNYFTWHDASLWNDPLRLKEAIAADAEFCATANSNMKMLTYSIQGFGKVGASLARILEGIGATVTTVSDKSGTLHNKRGIKNINELFKLCASGKTLLSDIPSDLMDGTEFMAGASSLPLTAIVDVIVPSALEEVVTLKAKPGPLYVNAAEIAGDYLLQGANGPVTPEAEEMLRSNGKICVPDILANSGGVLGSYLEWLNGLIRQFGYRVIFGAGFVHPVVHSLVLYFHPDALSKNEKEIDEKLYSFAFKFILRHATMEMIKMSYENKVSLRTAYMALGIATAAAEGRLSGDFEERVERMREEFAGGTV